MTLKELFKKNSDNFAVVTVEDVLKEFIAFENCSGLNKIIAAGSLIITISIYYKTNEIVDIDDFDIAEFDCNWSTAKPFILFKSGKVFPLIKYVDMQLKKIKSSVYEAIELFY